MKSKSIFLGAFGLLFLALIAKNTDTLSQKVISFSTQIKTTFISQKDAVLQTVETHFDQAKKIEELQKKIKILEPKASLSVAFASKLNHLLKETNLETFHPQLHLVQKIGYKEMQNYHQFWLEFPDFDESKIYGLIFQGYTAGIVRENAHQALAVMQGDEKSTFSVFIGKNQIEGMAFGANDRIMIRYIPNYESPQVGDEVITSGNDKIFYEGIKVGKVTHIDKQDMYQIAIVKPYAQLKEAQFFYAVDVK